MNHDGGPDGRVRRHEPRPKQTRRRHRTSVRFLAAIIRQRAGLFTVDLLVGAGFFAISLIPGLAIREFFDALAGVAPAASVLLAALGTFVALKAVNAVMGATWMAVDTVFRFRVSTQLRAAPLAHLLTRPGALPLPCSAGDSLSRLRDDAVEVAETLGKRGLLNVTSSLSFAGCAFVVMVAIDARVTLLAVVPALGVAVISFLASRQVRRLRAQNRQAAGEVAGLLREVFAGIEAVKLAGAGERIGTRLERVNRARRRAAVRDGAFGGILAASSGAVVAIGTGLIMIVAAAAMSSGRFSVGDLALFIYNLTELGIGVGVVGRFLSQYHRVDVSRDRLTGLLPGVAEDELLKPVPTADEGPPGPAAHETLRTFTVTGLGYRHPDGTDALRSVSFNLTRGSVTVVAGRVGAGKTTLLRVLLGLMPATEGELRWNGTPLRPGEPLQPPRAAYTPQAPKAFSETLKENVLLGLPDDGRLGEAIRQAALESDLRGFTEGVQTPVGPRGQRLSGGQLHRLAAARMLARPADLFVVDDLSASLDVDTESVLWQRLFDSTQIRTFLVVSNRRAVLRRADQVIVLSSGRVESQGTLEEVLDASEEFRRIWHFGSAERIRGTG